jgi:hypothetical protein
LCKGEHAWIFVRLTSAPSFSTRHRITARCPFSAATCRGVLPPWLFRLTTTPISFTRHFTIFKFYPAELQ